MENWIIVGVLLLIVGAAVFYICRAKKKGTRCIGCPAGGCSSCKGCKSTKTDCKCQPESR